MNKIYTYTAQQTVIERFLLGVFSIYNATIIFIAGRAEWGFGISILLMAGILLGWIIHVAGVRDYFFRASVMAFIMQFSVIVYAISMDDIVRALPTFIAFTILLGVYGIPWLVKLPFISTVIIFFYHAFISKTISFETGDDVIKIISQIANLLLVEYVIYVWTKRNRVSSDQFMNVIEELKIAESSKDDFVANVSHEIRTPINTICGMSELILKEDIPYDIKEDVLCIQMAGRNLMRVVSDILDFSELQSGKIDTEEESYNITSTLNDVINMAMAQKSEKAIELIVDCNPTMPSVLKGDEKKIRRIMTNLVDNAIKFTEKGCVTLRVGYRREEYGINLVISVKDTGIGISESDLEKLFVSFNQVDASRKRQEGGLGLGLAISYALISRMGGAITIKSKLGKGTIVRVVIPQKVLEETPIVTLDDRQSVKIATYINMDTFERLEVRDECEEMMSHLAEKLRVKCRICRNLAELHRRESVERFTHIFIGITEYREDKEYFDEISKKTKVVVIINRLEEQYVDNPNILRVYKPLYILSLATVLNASATGDESDYRITLEKFTTQDTKVLVVDDNRMNLHVIEEILKGYNIETETATSGKEALEKVSRTNYDFIFMDHMMPEMDGVETLYHIRQKMGTYYAKVPVIALTANAVAGAREALIEAGFNDFLEKPVERSVLERVLKRNIVANKIIFKTEDTTENNMQSSMESNMEKPKETNVMDAVRKIEGLDVEQGICYCNGEDMYLTILRVYCEEWDSTGDLTEESFKKKDWKNYTIAVHGLKSAMFSIGAIKISEMAKKLEMAGKEGRIAYIEKHHQELMDEYKALFGRLKNNELICPPSEKKKEDIKNLPEISKEDLERILSNMEEAMYALDETILLELVEELEGYQYKGDLLKEVLAPARRKIEMSDLFSAVEMITKWKNGLDAKENS